MGQQSRQNQSSQKARALGFKHDRKVRWSFGQWLRSGIQNLQTGYDARTGMWTRDEFVSRVLDFGGKSRRYATVEEHRAFLAAHNQQGFRQE